MALHMKYSMNKLHMEKILYVSKDRPKFKNL